MSGITNAHARGVTTFEVLPGNPGIDTFDLQFLEARRYVAFALRGRGFSPSTPGEQPQVVVFVGYGIDKNITRFEENPVLAFNLFPGSVTTWDGTVTEASGNIFRVGTSITLPPPVEIGSGPVSTTNTTMCTRHLVVRAVDSPLYRQTGRLRDQWKTSVVSEGTNCDLRAVLPALVLAAQAYFGEDTQRPIAVSIALSDQRIRQLRELRSP